MTHQRLGRLLFAAIAIHLLAGGAWAGKVNVTWPAGAFGGYQIIGAMKSPATESGSYDLPDGANYSIQGSGFRVSFAVKNGTVEFPRNDFGSDEFPYQFDAKTSTFLFPMIDVQVDTGNVPTVIGGDKLDPNDAATRKRTLKLVSGRQWLSYAGGRFGFRLGQDGSIVTDALAGVSVRNSVITFHGFDAQVLSKNPKWSIRGIAASHADGSTPLALLPGEYTFQSGRPAKFYVNDAGLLSLQKDGPFAEAVDFPGGADRITIPDGDAKAAARAKQEAADQSLHDRLLSATVNAAFKRDFELVEKMHLWGYDEQQITYPVELSKDVTADSLVLLAFSEKSVRAIPFQMSRPGDATSISFRTDLPRAASRLFRLVLQADAKDAPAVAVQSPKLLATENPNEAILSNGVISIKVPAGRQEFGSGKPLSQVPAPILGTARGTAGGAWLTAESFNAPDPILVNSIDAKLLQAGPIVSTYQVDYQLVGGKRYTTTLEMRANESSVSVAEAASGFTPGDQAFLRLNYGKGLLDPDHRLVASVGGADAAYDRYSGSYDRHASTDEHTRFWPASAGWLEYDPTRDNCATSRLDFRIGLYMPNCLGVVHAATFYADHGADALLLSIDQLEDWKTTNRERWTDFRSPDNLRFFTDHGSKYMETAISGPRRYWALSLIPREQVVMRALGQQGGGPEAWFSSRLRLLNLQAAKDRSGDWPEKLDSPTPVDVYRAFGEQAKNSDAGAMSFDDFKKRFMDKGVIASLTEFPAYFGSMNGRSFPPALVAYATSRAGWTAEQREQVRQILVLSADLNDGDDYQPSRSMLSGHPNFLMDAKQNVALAAAVFPNHPKARAWRDSFMAFFAEYMDRYVHPDVPELSTRGGRFTENIACYTGQSLVGVLNAQLALKAFDGTQVVDNPNLVKLVRWMRDALTSPVDGQRQIPRQGAHAYAFEPNGIYWKTLFKLGEELATVDLQLSKEMRWIDTCGKEGAKPDIRSALYTDYGPVFHSDFGGEQESYAHLQIISSELNYRWGHAGILYYGAKNKLWSSNTGEANGDQFDWTALTAFTVNNVGLSPMTVDQLLYDFGFAQFYRQPGKDGDAYRARGVMLLRDDYLAIYDEVKSPDVAGTFRWVNTADLPQIYQLKPGAPKVESDFDGIDRTGKVTDHVKRQAYSGQGDFLTIVAPSPVDAKAALSGAVVNGEYVFASQSPRELRDGPACFTGNYGYARANQLAIFVGSRIAVDGFELRREGGDFGVSAEASNGGITGKFVGRRGGTVSIIPPKPFDVSRAVVTIDQKAVKRAIEQGAIIFSVDIAQRDGAKSYTIKF